MQLRGYYDIKDGRLSFRAVKYQISVLESRMESLHSVQETRTSRMKNSSYIKFPTLCDRRKVRQQQTICMLYKID